MSGNAGSLRAKAADGLADRLRARILAGEWREGETLPTERELVDSAGLSRASVREALRILAGEGLIATRPGRGGGSAVRQPSADEIGRSVRLFIRGQHLGYAALLEAREAIEPTVSRLAARNRSDADLARLEEIQRSLVDSLGKNGAGANRARFLRANVDWHVAVAQASGNPLLLAFMSAIAQEILAWTSDEGFNTPGIVAATIRSHAQIIAAIRKQDEDAAERRMRRHVTSYGAVARSALGRAAD